MSDQHDELIAAIKSIATATEQSFSETVLFPIVLGLIGAYIAYLFSVRQSEVQERKNEKSRVAVELSELIQQLQANSVTYWCSDYDRQNLNEIELNEAQIHAGIKLIQTLAEELVHMEMTNGEREELTTVLNKFVSDAYDVITGGDFESTSRKASKNNVKKIVELCINARAKLSRYR